MKSGTYQQGDSSQTAMPEPPADLNRHEPPQQPDYPGTYGQQLPHAPSGYAPQAPFMQGPPSFGYLGAPQYHHQYSVADAAAPQLGVTPDFSTEHTCDTAQTPPTSHPETQEIPHPQGPYYATQQPGTYAPQGFPHAAPHPGMCYSHGAPYVGAPTHGTPYSQGVPPFTPHTAPQPGSTGIPNFGPAGFGQFPGFQWPGATAGAPHPESSPHSDAHHYEQFMGLYSDLMEGKTDPAKLASLLTGSGSHFWKGALVGAALTFLLTNSSVRSSLSDIFSAFTGKGDTQDPAA